MTVRRQYEVTDRAGDWVAGRRRPETGRLWLTDRQAAYELALGNIRAVAPEKPKGGASKRKRRKA